MPKFMPKEHHLHAEHAYTRATQYLDERKRMMQAWADYLAGLKAGGKVVAIKQKR